MNKYKATALMLSSYLFVLGSMLFWIGFHNMDIAFNMLRLRSVGIDVVDESFFGIRQTAEQAYMSGGRFVLVSFVFFMLSFLILLSIGLREDWI